MPPFNKKKFQSCLVFKNVHPVRLLAIWEKIRPVLIIWKFFVVTFSIDKNISKTFKHQFQSTSKKKKNGVHWKPNWLSKYLLQATIGDDAPREVKFTDDNGRVRIGTVTGTSVSSSVSVSTSTNNDAENIKGTIYK